MACNNIGYGRPAALIWHVCHVEICLLEEQPTVIEAGFPKLQSPFWLGVVAPAGTPPEIINKLNAAFRESLSPPETRARLDALGAEIKIGNPAEFEKMLANELAQWTAIVKAANIKAN
jgi:tripartite-type tricarboxylate transporter receptor subunit TctC